MSKNEERINEMKDVIRGELLKVDEGKIAGGDDLFYKAVEPDGVTEDSLKTHVKAVVNYSAAATGVSGEIALEAMKADPALEQVGSEFGLGALGVVKNNIKRESTYSVAGKEGTTYGANRAQIDFAPGRTGTPLNAETAAIKALFAAQFGE